MLNMFLFLLGLRIHWPCMNKNWSKKMIENIKVKSIWLIKDAHSYFSKFSFMFHLKNHHSKDVNLKFQLKWSCCLDVRSNFVYLQLCISYCVSLIMVTITRHIFINIFETEHFSAVKFDMGYEKNMNFLVIAKYPKVKKKKSWKDRTGLL